MERSGMSWNATAECGGGSGKGGGKNTTRSVARCGDFFQATCYTLVRYAFSCISERGRNTFLPALFVAWERFYKCCLYSKSQVAILKIISVGNFGKSSANLRQLLKYKP